MLGSVDARMAGARTANTPLRTAAPEVDGTQCESVRDAVRCIEHRSGLALSLLLNLACSSRSQRGCPVRRALRPCSERLALGCVGGPRERRATANGNGRSVLGVLTVVTTAAPTVQTKPVRHPPSSTSGLPRTRTPSSRRSRARQRLDHLWSPSKAHVTGRPTARSPPNNGLHHRPAARRSLSG